MRRWIATYADGRRRVLWACSTEQAMRQARLYGAPESVVVVSS